MASLLDISSMSSRYPGAKHHSLSQTALQARCSEQLGGGCVSCWILLPSGLRLRGQEMGKPGWEGRAPWIEGLKGPDKAFIKLGHKMSWI